MPGASCTTASISAGLTRKPPRRRASPMRVRYTKRPSASGVAEVARAVVAVGGERLARGLRVAVVGRHAARGREELEFARRAVRQERAGLRVARAHAGRRAHRPAARQHALGGGRVLVLAREQRLDFARAVQADQLQAARVGALHDVAVRRIEGRVAEETQVRKVGAAVEQLGAGFVGAVACVTRCATMSRAACSASQAGAMTNGRPAAIDAIALQKPNTPHSGGASSSVASAPMANPAPRRTHG